MNGKAHVFSKYDPDEGETIYYAIVGRRVIGDPLGHWCYEDAQDECDAYNGTD